MEKINRDLFEEQFEIFFGTEQTVICGETMIFSYQKQAFLKNRFTKEIISTNIFACSEELGEWMVINALCTQN